MRRATFAAILVGGACGFVGVMTAREIFQQVWHAVAIGLTFGVFGFVMALTQPAAPPRPRWLIVVKRMAMLFVALPCGLLALLTLVMTLAFGSMRPPTEKSLLDDFSTHRAVYERLRSMLLADTRVWRVHARQGVTIVGAGVSRPAAEVDVPVGRADEYVRLLDEAHAVSVFRRGERSPDVCILVWGAGFGGDTRHVEICALDHPPDNQIASLDAFHLSPKPRRPAFRHVDGYWYFWADW